MRPEYANAFGLRKVSDKDGQLLEVTLDISCKYMENATVHVWGDVRMDSIVNCDVSANGKVIATTGRGVIIGGTVRSMGGIEAKTIGNIAGRLTVLTIGPTPRFLEEKSQAERERLEKLGETQPEGQDIANKD